MTRFQGISDTPRDVSRKPIAVVATWGVVGAPHPRRHPPPSRIGRRSDRARPRLRGATLSAQTGPFRPDMP